MKSKIILTAFFLLSYVQIFASHNRGAKIEANFMNGFTYHIVITTYTRTSAVNEDRPYLDSVHTGDGLLNLVNRSARVNLANDLTRNIYSFVHTYPGFGNYLIYFIDPNRDDSILNIPNSVNVPLAVETEIKLTQNTCPVNSPVFFCIPFFQGAFNKDVISSYAAYNEDKDSLTYSLVACHGENNLPIAGYSIPAGVTLNPFSGEFTWDHNQMTSSGAFSFAVRVDQWRNGLNFGHSIQDLNIELENSIDTNYSFINTSSYPISPQGCYTSTVVAGTQFNLQVEFIDSLITNIELYKEPVSGLLFSVSAPTPSRIGTVVWNTIPAGAHEQPITLVFRGLPAGRDLTYLVYLTGTYNDSCSTWISIDDQNKESLISVYPNPASETLKLSINDVVDSKASVMLIDLSGKIIYNNAAFGKMEINLSDFASGIYCLRYIGHSGTISKMVVIQ